MIADLEEADNSGGRVGIAASTINIGKAAPVEVTLSRAPAVAGVKSP